MTDGTLSTADLQLNMRVSLIRSSLQSAIVVSARDYSLPYFETKEYASIVGPREPDYKKPFELNFSRKSSPRNRERPYYRQYKHMKVLGYMEPYPFTASCDICDDLGMMRPVEVTSSYYITPIMREFRLLDKKWGWYIPTDDDYNESDNDNDTDDEDEDDIEMMKTAMDYTKQLHSRVNRSFQVIGFSAKEKALLALNQDMRSSPGLPFCADATEKALADYLDRVLELAIEINESATKNPPEKVQAPPCTYGPRETEGGEVRGECVYPTAVRILETRFMFAILMRGLMGSEMSKLPALFLADYGPSLDDLIKNTKYGYAIKFSQMEFHMHPDFIEFAFSVIGDWFNMGAANKKVWEFVKYYFIHTPIVLPTGQALRKDGGGSLSSLFIRPVKGIVAVFVGVYCMLSQGMKLKDIKRNVHFKDDVLLCAVPQSFARKTFRKDAEELGFPVKELRVVKM